MPSRVYFLEWSARARHKLSELVTETLKQRNITGAPIFTASSQETQSSQIVQNSDSETGNLAQRNQTDESVIQKADKPAVISSSFLENPIDTQRAAALQQVSQVCGTVSEVQSPSRGEQYTQCHSVPVLMQTQPLQDGMEKVYINNAFQQVCVVLALSLAHERYSQAAACLQAASSLLSKFEVQPVLQTTRDEAIKALDKLKSRCNGASLNMISVISGTVMEIMDYKLDSQSNSQHPMRSGLADASARMLEAFGELVSR